jgi:hypothetical protein
MKVRVTLFLSVMIIAFVASSCSSKNITIVFNNQSLITIDSVVVNVQNRRFILINILPGSSLQKKIPRDSILFNQRDFMVRASVYDQASPHGREGMFYTDLIFAGSDDKYIITTSKDLKVTVVAE